MKTEAREEVRAGQLTTPLRLLLLEDVPADVEPILLQLGNSGIQIQHTLAENREEFLRAVQSGDYEAILADYHLPGWNALDALKELRASGKDIPFLLVTGALGEEAAVECIKQGVSDYILKDRLSRLPYALKRAIEEKKLREESSRAQAALAESETRARQQFDEIDLLYRTAPIYLAVLDRDLRYLRVNETLARNHGMPCSAFIGRSLYQIIPESAAEAAGFYRKVFATGEPIVNVEARVKRTIEPFEARDYLASFYPLKSANGEVYAACLLMVDITERKRAEEALLVSEVRNRDLVENSVYGIFRATFDGSFLDANPALLAMLGCASFEELRGLNLVRDIFRFPEQCAQLMPDCRDRGLIHGAEAEWRRRDGGLLGVRLHLRRLSIPNHPDAVECMAEDVTELRAVERQLRQAQKFEAIGQLAGGVAHDFNNVVGAILGWAELGFEQNKGNPQVAERFARIREQAERAAALTRELLAFARRQVLEPRPVDLNSITSALLSFLDKVIGKDIEIKVVTAPLDPIKADPTQIEQVLMNLCINAQDAMPQGGRLQIETEMVELDDSYCRFYPQVTPGRYAVLSVSDTGVGMDSEIRERIFEPFFTTKERGKGTGMGLATVYGIVKQHGGFIHVYSEPGQGSLFRVYLPALEGGPQEGASAKAPVPSLIETKGSETILIAEDHESIREMARQTLLSLGYRVLAACDGEEALRLCENEAPALAILDVIMPKLGGLATAEKLTALFDGLPILFTSGYSQDPASVDPVAAGTRYLQKPYSPTTLGRLVREILDQEKNREGQQ